MTCRETDRQTVERKERREETCIARERERERESPGGERQTQTDKDRQTETRDTDRQSDSLTQTDTDKTKTGQEEIKDMKGYIHYRRDQSITTDLRS